ncbi:MAG: hypothetical protein RIS36_1671 [Pseudomonadota bacterium]|jgi:hypothetical protein
MWATDDYGWTIRAGAGAREVTMCASSHGTLYAYLTVTTNV